MQIPGGFPGDSQTAQLASGVSQPDLRPPALRHLPVGLGVRGTVRLLQVSPPLVPVELQQYLPLSRMNYSGILPSDNLQNIITEDNMSNNL